MCENTIAFLPRSMRESLNIRSEELHIFVGSLEIDIYIYILYIYIYVYIYIQYFSFYQHSLWQDTST